MPERLSIASAAERLRGLTGWRGRLAAFVAGAASALAMAPFFLWPVLWVTLPVLVWLIDGAIRHDADAHAGRGPARRLWAAAETGWWWGLGYFLAGVHMARPLVWVGLLLGGSFLAVEFVDGYVWSAVGAVMALALVITAHVQGRARAAARP